ncbi:MULTISPECIES: anti-sigma factor antagonist [Bacillaceae]|jgi:anti-sigma B factor antagonist|uniref:Anti-sigma factor antagonist n=2 Tax=Bacillus infantis TaxID=324767 RepID=U5L4U5_9BACI|nr:MULTISPECIES: anti-sigma factor antagonist [Bacillus]OXT15710.1 anti-anti sigma factor [Bacillus sp. OG2]AGX02295.1 anti-sigma B factor antagonist [Bacillus infantis NRRL B-14911]EAR65014.1 anti-anti-sigma factor (antagonist of RsbW) [Bacillus sp. NRRL B-14911]MCA1037363.1 anti-sigma factor antagonist [Bacillus infantis]MCA1041752.1 anti-sigma factor antagonist [Bacillus infantis]
MNITIDLKENDTLVQAKISGEIDAYTAPKLRESLFPLSEKEAVEMVVDLSEVSYMDSTGLGVFVGVFKNVRSNNGKFQIVGLSERLKRLFEITGLADIIDINSQIEGGVQ